MLESNIGPFKIEERKKNRTLSPPWAKTDGIHSKGRENVSFLFMFDMWQKRRMKSYKIIITQDPLLLLDV